MRRTWVGMMMIVLTAAGTGGCVAWRRQEVTPQKLLEDPEVQVIRVTRRDRSTQVVYQPRIANDTLSGLPTEMAVQRITVPVADITEVATRYKHVGKTLLAGIAIIGGVAVYGLLQSLNTF